MIQTALTMLWIERKKAMSLCLSITATLCVCLIFIQFFTNPYLTQKITFSDIVSFHENYAIVLLGLGIFSICISLIVYSYHYYMRVHSRELGLLKLSGYTYLQIVFYQLIQMITIMMVSCLLTFILSIVFIPLSLYVIYYYCGISQTIFYYSSEGIKLMIVILLTILIIIIFLSIHYSVSSPITHLLKQDHRIGYREDKRILKIPDFIYLLAYIVGLYSMYAGETLTPGFAIAALIGVFGAYGMFYYWIPHAFCDVMAEGKMKGESYAILGDLSLFMQQSKTLIAFMMTAIILLVTFILSSTKQPMLHIALHIGCILINVLLNVSLINRFGIDDFEKKGHYHNLLKIGMTNKEVCQISIKQGQYFYLTLWIFTGVYIVSIFMTFYLRSTLDSLLAVIVLLEYIIPYLLSQIIVYMNKRRKFQ